MSDIAFDIAIPDSLIYKLGLADKKLKEIGDTSQKTQEEFNQNIQLMIGNVDKLIQKLGEADTKLASFGSKGSNNTNIGNIGTQAQGSIDAINKLVEAINKLAKVKENTSSGQVEIINTEEDLIRIAELKARIKEINAILKKGGEYGIGIDINRQQEYLNYISEEV